VAATTGPPAPHRHIKHATTAWTNYIAAVKEHATQTAAERAGRDRERDKRPPEKERPPVTEEG
jgi:hypothetical protein